MVVRGIQFLEVVDLWPLISSKPSMRERLSAESPDIVESRQDTLVVFSLNA